MQNMPTSQTQPVGHKFVDLMTNGISAASALRLMPDTYVIYMTRFRIIHFYVNR